MTTIRPFTRIALAVFLLWGCESAQPSKTGEPPATSAAPPAPPAAPESRPVESPRPAPAPPAAPAPAPAPVLSPAAPRQAAPEPARVLFIRTAFANVRGGAGTTARIVAVLKKGTRVEVLEAGNQWYRVRLADGREGWVAESVTSQTPE